jgi:hypothetical protein
MNEVILLARFAGAWLLAAGPLYQGSIELGELDFDREGMTEITASALRATEDRPSAWWWLLPPVVYVLHRRWTRSFKQAVFPQLTETQRKQYASYRNKATGWFTVATGATLLAAGETWQIVEHYDWPVWLFWLLIAVMITSAVLITAVQMIGNERTRRSIGAASAPTADQH